MKRRIFIQGGSAAAALALTGCGGSGEFKVGIDDATLDALKRPVRTPTTPITPIAPTPPAPPPAPGTLGYPFGSRKSLVNGRYPFGIAPTVASPDVMDQKIKTCYEAWKNALLKKSPTFTPNAGVLSGQAVTDAYHVEFPGSYACVSEGIAYGMMITVVMAGHDTNARTYFDGLFRTARGRPAYGHMNAGKPGGAYLHEWRLAENMGSAGDGWNATDGDLDIAMALLMAHRQWGSSGRINYQQEALNTIAAMKAINFAPTGEPRGPQRTNTRTSDHMIGHFRAFRAATGDSFWDTAITRCLTLIRGIIANFSPVAKLQPGFIMDCTTQPIPSPGNLIESPYEGIYDGNAIRNPWRWGCDYLFSGDNNWRTIVHEMTTFLKNDCGGNPANSAGLYNLDGTVRLNRYFAPGTVGPLTVGCMVDPAHQGFLNTLWTANTDRFSTAYYDSELQLIPLIVASGNWWNP